MFVAILVFVAYMCSIFIALVLSMYIQMSMEDRYFKKYGQGEQPTRNKEIFCMGYIREHIKIGVKRGRINWVKKGGILKF